ncbi:hypothetical protein MtrunA17_Chr2g0318891 [Medicago truncatula]|uniref:Transmembrane protein n=1 Tax=Medicago truncatula TaxID=3880 RepID=A0A396JFV3_MEDTR|nr:hypothetical protein MtrunA17_Chr2g0318891 [Medicago truncatula]
MTVVSSVESELETKVIKKSKISVAITAEATSSLFKVLLLASIAIIQDLLVSSSMKSSQAFEKTIGATPDIIFTSSLEFFIIFFILANGNECGPVLPMPPFSIPEYAPACLILFLYFSLFLSWIMSLNFSVIYKQINK